MDRANISVSVLSGGRAGFSKEFFETDQVAIGRSVDADVRLHPNEDSTVGRHHARIFFRDGEWMLEPLHRHGVFFQGTGLSGPSPVVDGMRVRLGLKGPVIRISVLDHSTPTTEPESRSADEIEREVLAREAHLDPDRPPPRRQPPWLALALAVPVVLLLAWWGLRPTASMEAKDIRSAYGASVIKIVVLFQLNCEGEKKAYPFGHGSAFVVANKGGWTYAFTNAHVFGAQSPRNVPPRRFRGLAHSALDKWKDDDWVKRHSRGRHTCFAERGLRYVAFVGGQEHELELLRSSDELDLSLLRFQHGGAALPPLPIRAVLSDDYASIVGESVFILGFPNGGILPFSDSHSWLASSSDVAEGIVSNVKNDKKHGNHVIQTTAPINPGNSGGPMFDRRGKVIAVNTYLIQAVAGIAYAVFLTPAFGWLDELDLLDEG